jgi:LysR family transcriptional regulator, benzoate and cis,cis-muconate-responsive activator of ben and cat genes
MELRHLRYFVAVAEDLSFRRAAHRLHVSHPALSQQIHDLENELDLKLFERNSRRVELTEAGRAFLLGGRRVLVAAKQAIAQAQEAAKGERGRLVIGSIGPLTSSFLPAALARFREQRPLVEATVLHMNNRVQVEALLNGSIMLGIGFVGSALDEDYREQLCTRLLLRSPVGIVCSKHRRFPKRAAPKLKDFHHDKFLSLDPEYGSAYDDWVRGYCKRFGGFEPEIGAIADSPESLVSMAAAGRGVLLYPEIAIRDRIAAIDFYRFNERENQFEIFTIWKKQPEVAPTIHKFVEVLEESVKSSEVVGRMGK